MKNIWPAEVTTEGRLIHWEKRVNTVLKIRPGHFHDVNEKKVCQFKPRIQYPSNYKQCCMYGAHLFSWLNLNLIEEIRNKINMNLAVVFWSKWWCLNTFSHFASEGYQFIPVTRTIKTILYFCSRKKDSKYRMVAFPSVLWRASSSPPFANSIPPHSVEHRKAWSPPFPAHEGGTFFLESPTRNASCQCALPQWTDPPCPIHRHWRMLCTLPEWIPTRRIQCPFSVSSINVPSDSTFVEVPTGNASPFGVVFSGGRFQSHVMEPVFQAPINGLSSHPYLVSSAFRVSQFYISIVLFLNHFQIAHNLLKENKRKFVFLQIQVCEFLESKARNTWITLKRFWCKVYNY